MTPIEVSALEVDGKPFCTDESDWQETTCCLQVNVKLGGANSRVQGPLAMPAHMRVKPYMIMGADVHHPPPADDVSPSIAAVVGSWDSWHKVQHLRQSAGVCCMNMERFCMLIFVVIRKLD